MLPAIERAITRSVVLGTLSLGVALVMLLVWGEWS